MRSLCVVLVLLAAGGTPAPVAEKPRVAVPAFEVVKKLADKETHTGASLARATEAALAGRHTVVGREALVKALAELEIREDALFDDHDLAAKLAKRVKARRLVVGRVSPLGKSLFLHVKVLDVERDDWARSVATDVPGAARLRASLTSLLRQAGLLGPTTGSKKKKAAPRTKEQLEEAFSSADVSVRFAAAVEAGWERRTWALIPLVRLLQSDRDIFVRRAAARSLGVIGTLDAVPPLIDALADGEYFVGVTANHALFILTRHDFGFRAELEPAEAARLVEKSHAWWKANREKVVKRRR